MPDRVSIMGGTIHIPEIAALGFSPDVAVILGEDNEVLSLRLNSLNNYFDVWEGIPFGAVGFVPMQQRGRASRPTASTARRYSPASGDLNVGYQGQNGTDDARTWPWSPIRNGTGPVGSSPWRPIRPGDGPIGSSPWSPIRSGTGPIGNSPWTKIDPKNSPAGAAPGLPKPQQDPDAPLIAIQIDPKSKKAPNKRLSTDVTLRKIEAGKSQFAVVKTIKADIMIDKPMITEVSGNKAVRSLAEFRSFADHQLGLSASEREVVVEQAIILVRDIYAHLPLKRAMHAIDPVQSLTLLKQRVSEVSVVEFHAELLSIFKDLRDLHTNLIMPTPFGSHVAFLGILVERFFSEGVERFIVSKIYPGVISESALEEGVEITHWNGMPIGAAVARNADKEAGSNLPSRMARGLETLTLRSLSVSLPPDEDWVDLTFIKDGSVREARLPWLVFNNASQALEEPAPEVGLFGELATSPKFDLGIDERQETFRNVKKLLFNPNAMKLEKLAKQCDGSAKDFEPQFEAWMQDSFGGQATAQGGLSQTRLPTVRPDEISASIVKDGTGREFGYLRLWTFLMRDRNIPAFLYEVMRFLDEQMPPDGLIIDVRGNGGGYILAAEFLLQLLTWRRITPEPAQFIATASSLGFAEAVDDMKDWRASLRQAVKTGALYSKGIPISSPALVNSVGQIYFGPVVLITDAYCYSACDMFAAGFQDHKIGTILGVDPQTGAGGANVVSQDSLVDSWPAGGFEKLPGNIGMRVSLRRTMRVGDQAGDPVEDLGVKPDVLHMMSRQDLMNGNLDLLTRAISILKEGDGREFALSMASDGSTLDIQVKTTNVDRIEVYQNGRHEMSDTPDDAGVANFRLNSKAGDLIEIVGYQENAIVAKRKIGLE